MPWSVCGGVLLAMANTRSGSREGIVFTAKNSRINATVPVMAPILIVGICRVTQGRSSDGQPLSQVSRLERVFRIDLDLGIRDDL